MKIDNQTQLPFFDMKDANDLFNKLEYDFKLLTNNKENTYMYMNFIFTANHLKEWVENDNKLNRNIKNNVKKIFNLKVNEEYSTIKSLCNKSKHFFLKEIEYEKNKQKEEGFDFNKIDFSNFSFCPVCYYVQVGNKSVELYKVCEKIYNDWTEIMKIER